MKINFSSEITGIKDPHNRLRESEHCKIAVEQIRANACTQNYNKPAGKNPCGFVTFKGGLASKVNQLSTKAVNSEKFNKAVRYVFKHEAMFNALISLGIVATIRPLITLSMPVADKKDKVAVASKEIIGGVVGYGLANLIFKPINVAVIKVTENANKYIRNDNNLLRKLDDKVYKDAFISFWKNIPDTVAAPTKGVITVALMPFVIAGIDKLRSGKKKPPTEQEIALSGRMNEQYNQTQNNEIFSKIVNPAKASNPAFKGNYMKEVGDQITDKLARGLGWVAKTRPAKATTEGISQHFDNPTQAIQILTSAVYTLSVMNKTAKSKKIEKERKPMLMINAALVTAISSVLTVIVDKITNPIVDKMIDSYKAMEKPEGWLPDADFATGLKKMKSFTVFTSIVRFMVPVIMVPVAGAIVNKIKSKKESENKAS